MLPETDSAVLSQFHPSLESLFQPLPAYWSGKVFMPIPITWHEQIFLVRDDSGIALPLAGDWQPTQLDRGARKEFGPADQ